MVRTSSVTMLSNKYGKERTSRATADEKFDVFVYSSYF